MSPLFEEFCARLVSRGSQVLPRPFTRMLWGSVASPSRGGYGIWREFGPNYDLHIGDFLLA